jgi:phage gp29-like protein
MPIFDPDGNVVSSDGPETTKEVTHPSASGDGSDSTSRYRSDLRKYEDPILNRSRKGLDGYKELLTDSQVYSTMQQRRLAVVDLDWTVEPASDAAADKSAADFMRDAMEHVKWGSVLKKMHYTVFYGFSVAEMMWETDGTYVFADAVKVRDRDRFKFDQDGEPRLDVSGAQDGKELPDRKMWWTVTGGDHDDLAYGMGLAHLLYWPVTFKREGIKSTLTFLDRYAHPTPIGKFPAGTSKDDRDKLLQALRAMYVDEAIIVPEGIDVDQLQGGTGTQSEAFRDFRAARNADISKVVLGQTMTTDDATTGLGSTQGEVHERVKQQVVGSDASILYESWRRHPMQWLVQWNFPEAEMPRIRHELEEEDEEDRETAAKETKTMAQAGWERTQESVDETFGPGTYEKKDGGPRTADRGGSSPAFAEFSDETPIPQRFAESVSGPADEVMAQWMEEVRDLLAEAGSLSEFSVRLVELYPEMDPEALSDVLGDGMAASRAGGRVEVIDRETTLAPSGEEES